LAGPAASAEQAAALPPGARDAVVGPQQEAVAWDAAEEPQQEAAASVEAAVPRQVAAEPAGWCSGGRRSLRRCFGFSIGTNFFLRPGLRHNQRRGLRVRWRGCKLHRGKSRRGKQHETKFCHEDLGSRKIIGNEFW
jgi:hypothetical protein